MTHIRFSPPLRLPDLRSVVVLDSRQPGMFHMDDLMQAGSSRFQLQLQDLQKKILFDDPINILFTSVLAAVYDIRSVKNVIKAARDLVNTISLTLTPRAPLGVQREPPCLTTMSSTTPTSRV